MAWAGSLLGNDIFVLSVAVLSGLALGRLRWGRVSLGVSGTLFTGLALGLLGFSVSRAFFSWNLVVFVVSVGLLAAEDVVLFLKQWGLRFVLLGVAVTATGALSTFLFALLAGGGIHPHVVAGTYVGALTSSPGLGAAVEAAGDAGLITAGYTIAYPFGVLAVVLFVQLVPVLAGIDVAGEREELKRFISTAKGDRKTPPASTVFSLASFVACVVFGMFLGSVALPVPGLGGISLGSTGGALVVSLLAGVAGRIGPLEMRMNRNVLSALRVFSLAFFLASVGLMSGPAVLEVFRCDGCALLLIGAATAVLSLAVGYLLGRKLWKLNWILLAGAICGAMTSTPGLGAAIDATGTEDCAAGYGATYPVALFCMVLFTTLLIAVTRLL
ncbi:MAG: YidE/YbjL duplication [Synergistota bacterium]|nr:YidE/YbjL duplication [Synergistota bacterium]